MDIEWNDPVTTLANMGTHVGLWRWELSSNQVQWSEHLLDMLGLKRSEFVEDFSFFEDLLHPDDTGAVQAHINNHLSSGAPYRFRCRLRHADGHYVTTLAHGSALRDPEGRPIELVGTVIDVSAEVQAAQELVQSERSFQSLAENVPGAIFRYVLSPDGTDAVEYMSSGCLDIWEVEAEEVQRDASVLWSVVFPEDLPAMQASVATSAQNLTGWSHRWRIKTPSGAVKHLEGRGLPTRLADGSIMWDSLILDVSQDVAVQGELASQQKMLHQAQKMEAIGRISGGIAHDFNNLLAIMMGNAELAMDTEELALRQQFLREIVDAGARGSQLTRQLLSFARQSQLNPSVVKLDVAIKGISTLIRRTLPENISLNVVQTAGLWDAMIDQSFLESAILNLCINARDAMPNGGKLTIETSNIRVSKDYILKTGEDIAPGRYVLIAVTDTGIGIPPSELARVVEPFFSTKPPDAGSGMGLAMVDGFARQSNGVLRIYSEVGSGTTIKLYLPAESPDNDGFAPATRADQTVPTKGRGRILVVEDEASISNVIRMTLERVGYDVSVASSGDEALALYSESISEFDALLSDVVMPGNLQGPALAQALVEKAPSLKVVFISGYPNEAAIHGNGIRANDLFLMKPVLRADLLQKVDEAINQQTKNG